MIKIRRYLARSIGNRGFIAVTSIMLLVSGCLALNFVVIDSAGKYYESVELRIARMQGSFDLDACLDEVKLMVSRDFFFRSSATLKKFNCVTNVQDYGTSQLIINATTTTKSITIHKSLIINI